MLEKQERPELAPSPEDYYTKENLERLIQEGIDSESAGPFDSEDFMRRAADRFQHKKTG